MLGAFLAPCFLTFKMCLTVRQVFLFRGIVLPNVLKVGQVWHLLNTNALVRGGPLRPAQNEETPQKMKYFQLYSIEELHHISLRHKEGLRMFAIKNLLVEATGCHNTAQEQISTVM